MQNGPSCHIVIISLYVELGQTYHCIRVQWIVQLTQILTEFSQGVQILICSEWKINFFFGRISICNQLGITHNLLRWQIILIIVRYVHYISALALQDFYQELDLFPIAERRACKFAIVWRWWNCDRPKHVMIALSRATHTTNVSDVDDAMPAI